MLFSLKALDYLSTQITCKMLLCNVSSRHEFNAQDHFCPQIPSSVLITCLNREWCLQPRFQERGCGVCQAEISG